MLGKGCHRDRGTPRYQGTHEANAILSGMERQECFGLSVFTCFEEMHKGALPGVEWEVSSSWKSPEICHSLSQGSTSMPLSFQACSTLLATLGPWDHVDRGGRTCICSFPHSQYLSQAWYTIVAQQMSDG